MKRSLCLLCLALGACGPTMDLGRDPDILWWSNFESGTTSDLTAPPSAMGFADTYGGASLAIESGGHLGSLGARLRLPAAVDCCVGTRLVRQDTMPMQGFYSAWLRIPANVTPPAGYWAIMKLTDVGTVGRDDLQMFDVFAVRRSGGVALSLYVHPLGGRPGLTAMPLQTVAVMADQWTHVELFLNQATDQTGLVRLWQDGTLLFEVKGPTSFPTAQVRRFSLTSVSENNPPLEIFVDDMAISLRRLGPETSLQTDFSPRR